jgi:hypothetical protein
VKHLFDKINEAIKPLSSPTALDEGSDGVIFDLGNGTVKKILFPPSDNMRKKAIDVVEKWINVCKKGKKLTTIPNIEVDKWDEGEMSYIMPKYKLNTPKCKLINDAVWKFLIMNDIENDPKKLQEHKLKMEAVYGEAKTKYAMKWCEDFIKDYRLITGNEKGHMSDDIRLPNLGEDKRGNVWCFDWYDPYCD